MESWQQQLEEYDVLVQQNCLTVLKLLEQLRIVAPKIDLNATSQSALQQYCVYNQGLEKILQRFQSNLEVGRQLPRMNCEAPEVLQLFTFLNVVYRLQKMIQTAMASQPLLNSKQLIELTALWKYNVVKTE